MLLIWDELDDFSWDNIDPDGELQDDELIVTNAVVQEVNDVATVEVPLDLNQHRPLYVKYSPGNYDLVREAIKVHFNWKYNRGNDSLIKCYIFYLTL